MHGGPAGSVGAPRMRPAAALIQLHCEKKPQLKGPNDKVGRECPSLSGPRAP